MSKSICSIIVTYNSKEEISKVLQVLMEQVQYVYIVDNGSDKHTIRQLQKCSVQYPDQVKLILNESNIGLAAAQNQGIRLALAEKFEWVLLLDDDSLPETAMVEHMLAAWQERNDKHIAILAPRIVESNVAVSCRYLSVWGGVLFRRKTIKPDECLSDVAMVISSGSMIKSKVFFTAGLMNEGFFIDSVDHEFCLRARHKGYTILVVGNAELCHRQGEKHSHKLLGIIPIITSGHNAKRRYSIFRNRMFMLRRHGWKFPFLLLHEVTSCAWDVVRILLLEPEKKEKLSSAWRGLAHGLTHDIPEDTLL